jgi:putative nucleotidyltransferase with HDIG domain
MDLEAQNNRLVAEIVYTLARIMEVRDASLFTHGAGTAGISLQFGNYLKLSEHDMTILRWGTLLHDIGMLAMPDFISFKPSTLSTDEWMVVHQHPEFGVAMLSELAFLAEALPIIEFHHERWDGGGYPRGLKGEEIPYLARICAITNIFDAMTSDKIYRPGFNRNEALEKMRAESGKVFDPVLLDQFTTMMVNQKDMTWQIEDLFGLTYDVK